MTMDNNLVLEEAENKNVKMILSRDLRSILSKINHVIAKRLINADGSKSILWGITAIQISSKNDALTFLPGDQVDRALGSSNMVKTINEADIETLRSHQPLWANNRRVEQNVGRVIRRLFGNEFPDNVSKADRDAGKIPDPPTDIETFVNLFKAAYDTKNESVFERFKLIDGTKRAKNIRHYYHRRRYATEEGGLGNSCMKQEDRNEFMFIYDDNPEVCQLLILKDEKDPEKIRGRALIWKLTKIDGKVPEGERFFMDRIYTILDAEVEIFKAYAKKQGWFHKQTQTYENLDARTYIPVTDTRDGTTRLRKLETTVKAKKYELYPYVDTMQLFNPKTGVMTSDLGVWDEDPDVIHLNRTNGSYRRNDGNFIESRFHGRRISANRAVQCIDGDYVLRDVAVQLQYLGGYASPAMKTVTTPDDGRLYLEKDCVLLPNGNYIYKDRVRRVFRDREGTKVEWMLRGNQGKKNGYGVVLDSSLKAFNLKRPKDHTDHYYTMDLLYFDPTLKKYYFLEDREVIEAERERRRQKRATEAVTKKELELKRIEATRQRYLQEKTPVETFGLDPNEDPWGSKSAAGAPKQGRKERIDALLPKVPTTTREYVQDDIENIAHLSEDQFERFMKFLKSKVQNDDQGEDTPDL